MKSNSEARQILPLTIASGNFLFPILSGVDARYHDAVFSDHVHTFGILRPMAVLIAGVWNALYLVVDVEFGVHGVTHKLDLVKGVAKHFVLTGDAVLDPYAVEP